MHYAFIIGANQDWPEQRTTHGDKALSRCLQSVRRGRRVPKENLVELYDECATRSNILKRLSNGCWIVAMRIIVPLVGDAGEERRRRGGRMTIVAEDGGGMME